MANIRKRGTKWQVQVRRKGMPSLNQSFHLKQDAQAWARQVELQADRREFPQDRKALDSITLGELVERYRDTVCIKKRSYEVEKSALNFFLRHPLCSKRLSDVSAVDFAAYRDERLNEIKPSSLKRQLCPLHHLFEVARDEWGIPLDENPLGTPSGQHSMTLLEVSKPPSRRQLPPSPPPRKLSMPRPVPKRRRVVVELRYYCPTWGHSCYLITFFASVSGSVIHRANLSSDTE